MVYGYSARLIDINKKADRKLIGVRLGRACIRNDFLCRKLPIGSELADRRYTTGSTGIRLHKKVLCRLSKN
jgi:hypothetical protein